MSTPGMPIWPFDVSLFTFISGSIGWRLVLQLHRLRQGVHFEFVVLDLLDLVPREPGGVFDRFFQLRRRVAVRDDVEPVKIAPAFAIRFSFGDRKMVPVAAPMPLTSISRSSPVSGCRLRRSKHIRS